MWVADSSDDKIYAYNMSDKARVSSKDFDTLDDAGNESGRKASGPTELRCGWQITLTTRSTPTTCRPRRAIPARISTPWKTADNESPTGIWSDRTTMWVADYSDEKIYAYNAPETAVSNMNRAPTVTGTPPTQQTLSLTTGDSQTFGRRHRRRQQHDEVEVGGGQAPQSFPRPQ